MYRRVALCLRLGRVPSCVNCLALADCKSAIQQIENLRYESSRLLQHIPFPHNHKSVLSEGENDRTERVQYELRSSGVHVESANPLRSGIHSRGYLPHVKREGARYFVTFRLADSLPPEVFLKIQARRAERLRVFHAAREVAKNNEKIAQARDELQKIESDYHKELEHYLDQGCGQCWLRRGEIAKIVAGALRHFDNERYTLYGWVVMPNHVHVVLWPMPNHDLSAIVQSWKRYSAREANKILGRTGNSFWQPEAFDHWIRNDEEHARCCRYVLQNPVKARLCESPEKWRWSSAWRETKAKL